MLVPGVQLVNETWQTVFDFDFPVWDGQTKQGIAVMILSYYLMREIGMETYYNWYFKLRSRMIATMPYFCDVAAARKAMGNVFENNLASRVINTTEKETQDNSTDGTVSSNSTTDDDRLTDTFVTVENQFSDTPQNGLQSVKNGTYLTTAEYDDTQTVVEDKNTNTFSSAGNSHAEESRERNRGQDVTEKLTGFNGSKTQTMIEARDALKLVEVMLLESLADLFISIW